MSHGTSISRASHRRASHRRRGADRAAAAAAAHAMQSVVQALSLQYLGSRLLLVWVVASTAEIRATTTGSIPQLVELVRSADADGKAKAAGALANLAYNADNKVAIAETGAIAPLVELARSGDAARMTQRWLLP